MRASAVGMTTGSLARRAAEAAEGVDDMRAGSGIARPGPHAVAGAVASIALLAVAVVLIASPATAGRDPDDVGGPLDVRSVTGVKDAIVGPLTVTLRTWDEWGKRLLRKNGPNRTLVMFDVDDDDQADSTARIVRSGASLVATIAQADGSTTTLPASRPSRSTVTFTVPAGSDANPIGDVGVAARTRSRTGAVCRPSCRDRSPDEGFDLVVVGGSPSPTPSTSPSPPGGQYTCTELVGFSQTRQWSLDVPDFQDSVGDAAWQVRWAPGGAIYFWADPEYEGWDGAAESPCSTDADAPARVVLTITSQNYENDASSFVIWIEDAVEVVRSRFPSVEQIVLQPVVGGPGNGSCVRDDGGEVRASHNHPLIDAAIAQVVGGDVVAGPSPEVPTCDDYADSAGHLEDAARASIAQTIADGYV